MGSENLVSNNSQITFELDKPQKGQIKVHSHILKDLSSGIYSSPAMCIKELVNNSFDADANIVRIRIKPIQDTIVIMDDGEGMNAKEFDENFAWISKSNKRNDGPITKSGRPKIGKIGIGFISVNEICDQLEITSTKKGEPRKFKAKINFKKYREVDEEADGGILKGEYELVNTEEDVETHYTTIKLIHLTDSVVDILTDQQYIAKLNKDKYKNFDKPFFKSMNEVLDAFTTIKIKTFSEENAYTKFIIDLASYIPVEYVNDGPFIYDDPIINQLINNLKNFNFKVDLDGMYLKKPILFNSDKFLIKTFKETLYINENTKDKLEFSGYFYAQDHLVVPREINGLSIKIKNVPIAQHYGYDTTFMYYPSYTDQLFRNWISGEIYITEGLEDAMNIDRQSFRETHPHYLKLQNYVHKLLREEIFSKMVNSIYEDNRKLRIEYKKDKTVKVRSELLKSKNVITEEAKPTAYFFKSPVEINKSDNSESKIMIDKTYKNSFGKKDWEILENIFVVFEIAYEESNGDIEKLRTLFYEKIKELSGKGI